MEVKIFRLCTAKPSRGIDHSMPRGSLRGYDIPGEYRYFIRQQDVKFLSAKAAYFSSLCAEGGVDYDLYMRTLDKCEYGDKEAMELEAELCATFPEVFSLRYKVEDVDSPPEMACESWAQVAAVCVEIPCMPNNFGNVFLPKEVK